MKTISSYPELIRELKSGKLQFLLLYKKGNPKSDCAFRNISSVDKNRNQIAVADVTTVKDIHTHYNITTAPVLIEFSHGQLLNIVKGCQEKTVYSTILNSTSNGSSESGSNKTDKSIVVYTTPTCTYCNAIKSYLRNLRMSFREIDITRDSNAASEMVRRSGQQGVPQTVINGQLIVGFDKKKLDEILEIN